MTAAESTEAVRPGHQTDVEPPEPDDLATDLDLADLAALPEATPRQLFWRAFSKHKLALFSLILILLVYLVVIFAEFLAPGAAEHVRSAYALAPPQVLHFFGHDGDGHRVLMYVYGYSSTVDPQTNAITYQVDHGQLIPVRLFAGGDHYRLFGLIPLSHHLIGPVDANQPFFLLGSDVNGRDLLSRVIFGTRISMSIGLVGVALAFVLGIILGGLSGYFGGRVDTVIQRLIELLMSIPTLPLWLALAAAMPLTWGAVSRYFAITVILAIVAWTGLARVVRGRFLALRSEEYVMAAQLDGNSVWRTTMRHMLPAFNSHLIAQLTLSIPAMIIAETSLSFLGLGLTAPAVSWGVLLQAASSIQVISSAPWLLIPGVAVVITVLALNFLGDGLRDAADPYGH